MKRSFLLLALGLCAFATAKPESAFSSYKGVLVRFHGVSVDGRDRLHAKLGTKLLYRSGSAPTDWVAPASLAGDETALQKLCALYRKTAGVERCSLNQSHEPAQERPHAKDTPDGGARGDAKPNCAETQHGGIDRRAQAALLAEYARRKLTPFWAQEYIGADLSKEVFAKLEGSTTVPVGIIDGGLILDHYTGPSTEAIKKAKDGFVLKMPDNVPTADKERVQADLETRNTHGAGVMNILLGAGPMGVGASGHLTFFHAGNYDADWLKAADLIGKATEKPRILNISMGLGTSSEAEDALKRFAEHSIVVAAAGNKYPERVGYNAEAARAIVVSSITPSGAMTHYANYSPSVAIAAPSDDWILSKDGVAAHSRFGGTSGAAPAVSGALMKVLARLGDVTVEQAKTLLVETALPTLNGRATAEGDGKGTLNDLKLLMAAERLRAMGWKDKSKAQRDEMLKDARKNGVYDFSRKKEGDALDAKKALEDGTLLVKDKDCRTKAEGLKLLRQAFNLTSGKDAMPAEKTIAQGAAKELAAAYRAMGYTSNAEFYENFDEETAFKNLQASLESTDPDIRASSLRSLALFTDHRDDRDKPETPRAKKVRELLTERLRDPEVAVRTVAALETSMLRPEHAAPLIEKAMKDDISNVRRAGVLSAYDLPEEKALPIMTAAMKDFSYLVRIDVVRSALNFKDGIKLLALGSVDTSPHVRFQTAGLLGDIKENKDQALELLMRMAARPSEAEEILSLGSVSVGKVGPPEGVTLYDMIANDRASRDLDDATKYAKTLALWQKLRRSTAPETRLAMIRAAKFFKKEDAEKMILGFATEVQPLLRATLLESAQAVDPVLGDIFRVLHGAPAERPARPGLGALTGPAKSDRELVIADAKRVDAVVTKATALLDDGRSGTTAILVAAELGKKGEPILKKGAGPGNPAIVRAGVVMLAGRLKADGLPLLKEAVKPPTRAPTTAQEKHEEQLRQLVAINVILDLHGQGISLKELGAAGVSLMKAVLAEKDKHPKEAEIRRALEQLEKEIAQWSPALKFYSNVA